MREPFRFCYCSCYTRGLVELLQYVWQVIFSEYPQAELHCYYGTGSLDQQAQQRLTFLMGQPGVMDHSRRPMKDIILEKTVIIEKIPVENEYFSNNFKFVFLFLYINVKNK